MNSIIVCFSTYKMNSFAVVETAARRYFTRWIGWWALCGCASCVKARLTMAVHRLWCSNVDITNIRTTNYPCRYYNMLYALTKGLCMIAYNHIIARLRSKPVNDTIHQILPCLLQKAHDSVFHCVYSMWNGCSLWLWVNFPDIKFSCKYFTFWDTSCVFILKQRL